MSSTENLLATVTGDMASNNIVTQDLSLSVQHTNGKVDISIVSVAEDVRPSEVVKNIWKTAKDNMTRMEKIGLALHLLKAKVYTEPIRPVDSQRPRHEAHLTDALKHPETLDAHADAFLTKYHDLYAGNRAVLIKISFDKSTLSIIGRTSTFLGGVVLHICLDS